MEFYILFCAIFCVAFITGRAVDQPVLQVVDNNLYVIMPPNRFIDFSTSAVTINRKNIMPILAGAENATKLLSRYETFISQYQAKMDDIESRLNLGYILFPGNTTASSNSSAALKVSVRLLQRSVGILQRNVRNLQELLTNNECASNPCQSGGSCIDLFNGFLCQCPKGWEGPTCQIDINECARFVGTDLGCQNGGTCLNLPGSYQCQCTNGWIGTHCNRKPTDCNSATSEICGHGTCIPQNNEAGYKCLCDSGWTTDGIHLSCSVDVDECKQNHPPCSKNPLVQCINLPGTFMCQHCPPGYTGNGYYCADINECELFNGGCSMSPYVECVNSPGSFKCGLCPVGYEGNGKTCVYKGVCNVNNGGCNMLARCLSNPAISETYVQCICPAGYIGAGIGPTGCLRTSSQVPTSCIPNPCVHGSCAINNATQSSICTCKAGFTGDLCDQAKNECSPNPCLNGGTCMMRRRRVTCSCPAGFIGKLCQRQKQDFFDNGSRPAAETSRFYSACGDNFNSSNGTIKYPANDFESSRGDENLSCAWTIKTQENKVLEITFTKFNFADPPCVSQWFQVHDGKNSLAPPLGRVCGKTLPFNGSLTTTQNIIYFWLRTNAQSSKKPEFELSWKTKDPVCGGQLAAEGFGMITSPGWPYSYPNNRECFWRYSLPPSKRLLFHVYSLDIGTDSDCSGDFLEFSGMDTQYISTIRIKPDEQFAKFCNSTIPQPFYSFFTMGTIRFKSNEKNSHGGFTIGYGVVDGIPGCGGTYTNKDGYIKSIEMTTSMPRVLVCAYEIKLAFNSTIKLEILEINLDPQCVYTYLEIYVEGDTGLELLGKYCGDTIPGPIITYGRRVLIKAESRAVDASQWKIKYTTLCHNTYTKPTDTIDTNDLLDCYYLIAQPPGNIIMLEIDFSKADVFSIPSSVMIWDGDNENCTLLSERKEGKIQVESTANYILMKITKPKILNPAQVRFTYTTLDLGCGGLLKKSMGAIAYPPRGVEKYSGNKKCRWVIVAPPGEVIQLTKMTFSLEQSFDCSYDYVQVFDNNTEPGFGGMLGKYCGFTIPTVILSSSNIMTLDFRSDNTIHGDGFLFSYTFIKEKNVCGGNYFTPAGIIKSPGYPNNYPTNRECIWVITVPPGSQIMLKFANFSLESYSSCRYDWLEVRNGGTSASPLIGKYCGNTYPKTIPSHTNKLYIKFNSDMSKTGKGFKLLWTSAATGCGGTLSSPSGSIMSPHYPEPYTKSTECYWKISISAGSKIQIIFADLDLEKHSACGLDYIQLFDGPNMNTKSLGRFCSIQTNPVVSSSNNMFVKFRSDVSFQGRGFNIQYNTICKNKLTGFRGVIESPNFPNDYPQDQDCVWEISVYEGNKINISFSHFALERSTTFENKSCAFDYVEIQYAAKSTDYIDPEPEWEKYDRYCGDKNPGFITLDSNLARVHFVSDSLLLGTGFRLEWQLFGCGGILTEISGQLKSPNYPSPYPSKIQCNWLIRVPFGQSIGINFQEIDVERESSCSYDYIQIFNGRDDTYPHLATVCHQLKPVTVTSSGNEMFVRFNADYSYEGRGFIANYESTPTTCGGYLTAPTGFIFSPNYPKNFNKNETCEWSIEIDENHIIEMKFTDVDLIKSTDCKKNYIKVYDGPTQAYPLLETICGSDVTPNKTIRSSYEHMLVEFSSDFYLTSKGFHAEYRKACGARIKTSGSGQIELRKEFDFTQDITGDFDKTCSYTIESEDKSKHVTLTITQLDLASVWCDHESKVLEFFNGDSKNSPLIEDFCSVKLPPPFVSGGSAIHIEVLRPIDFFATYSVTDDHCGGEFLAMEGHLSTPGWPNSYPNNVQCSWSIRKGPGNTIKLNFIGFDIPESEQCNTDFLEIREGNETGRLLGVFCGKNAPLNISVVGTLHLIFKSSQLVAGESSLRRGFFAEYATLNSNQLSGSEGEIGNVNYPDFNLAGSSGTFTYLITTNSSTVIEFTILDFFLDKHQNEGTECYGNALKIYDGMDSEAPLLKEICGYSEEVTILSTSNMLFVSLDFYSVRTQTKYYFKWKELPKKDRKSALSNGTSTDCSFAYKLEGQTNTTLTSPGYPNGYATDLNCEWIYKIDPQYHLTIKFKDVNFGTLRVFQVCTYSDLVRVYSKSPENSKWEMLKEFCTNTKDNGEVIVAANLLKVEFITNKFLNGTGFKAQVFGVCGGTMTDPTGVIEFDKDHLYDYECQWNVTVRPGRTIKLTFEKFDFPNDPNCKNYLIIRNGKFHDSPFLGSGKYCGPENPPDLQSTSNHLYLKYSGLKNIKGFKLLYTEVSVQCGEDMVLSVDVPSIEIASPNYPEIPPAHSECIWICRAPPGEALRVDFKERFDISAYSSCSTDYVELRDGGTEISPLIGTFCYEEPDSQLTTDNTLRIKYFTDSNEPRNGFKAIISIATCGGTFKSEGTINSKKPFPIRPGSNCTWYIKPPINFKVIINFSLLNLGPERSSCKDDEGKIIIYGQSPLAKPENVLAVICGRNATEIRSNTNEVRISYLPKLDQDEFMLSFTFEREDCGETLEQESGTITSPGYPVSTQGNRYCFWRIKVPKGRRITLFMEDIDVDFDTVYMILFQGYSIGPKIVSQNDVRTGQTFDTSDNGARILFWQDFPLNKRGFKIRFTSDKPSVCIGDFNETSGVIPFPRSPPPYRCEYEHSKRVNEETLAISIEIQTNETNIHKGCIRGDTGIEIVGQNEHLAKICHTTNAPVIFRSTDASTTLIARENVNTSLTFTIQFKTYNCGGELSNSQGTISSPNFPNIPQNSMECAWKIRGNYQDRIKLNVTNFDLGDDCEKSYLIIYNGFSSASPRIGKYCKKNKPEVLISESRNLLIEYSYQKGDSVSKGFSLNYEFENRGCGGIYHSRNNAIRSPNYPKDYQNNEECIWDVISEEGYTIKLSFMGRFYLEASENCTKDYIEIFDWKYDNWESLGRKCGRVLPSEIFSTSNKIRILFRSNEKIAGTGFWLESDWECGGVLEAVQNERYLTSPKYPYSYRNIFDKNCTYKIVTKKPQGVVSIKFLDFNLGSGIGVNCEKANLTIIGTSSYGRALTHMKQVYCGTNSPTIQRYKGAVIISSMIQTRLSFGAVSGFKLAYKDEFCGGNITSPMVLQSPESHAITVPGIMRYYQARISCTWYITAPPDQIPVLIIHKLSMSFGIHCIVQHLDIFDGLESNTKKRLAQLCGKIEENKPIPASSNKMLVMLESTPYNFHGFQGEIYFTYGPAVGCGGTVNLTETKYINSPNNLPHMDCHWTIIAPQDYKVELEFTSISVSTSCENPVRNHTYYCTCSYIEIRDGGSPFADQMSKLCSSDNNLRRTFTTSWNTAYLRLYSAVPQNDMFRLTVKPVLSKCGPSHLTATKQLQQLTSPDYPNNYPENIKCTWVIRSPTSSGRFMIHFEEFDFPGDSSSRTCDSDRLELTEDPNRHIITEGYGPTAKHQLLQSLGTTGEAFKYAFCGNETKPFDYYSAGNEVTLTFNSFNYVGQKGKGFKLTYGSTGCNRTIKSNEGRIQSDISNTESSNCEITIIAEPNRTMSIYFIMFYFINSDTSCSKSGLEIREYNSTGKQLLKACGFRLPNPIFTNVSQVYIKTYNNMIASSYFKYNFLYISSEKGVGCGGKLFNYMGKFSSPMYPNPNRADIVCTWDVMVPKGFKVALKFREFNIGGGCARNKVEVITNSQGIEDTHTFCPENTAAIMFSDNSLRVTYYSSVNNGGNGWLAIFQAVKEESDTMLWF